MINDVTAVSSQMATSANAATQTKLTLDKDAFLKIFLAQLQYQDPLNPADGTEFIAELAQFGMLEQLTNLTEALTRLLQFEQKAQAAALIGKTVKIATADKTLVEGVVAAVRWSGDQISLVVNGQEYSPDQVIEVR
ncbi:hypothetical protein ciss_20960 [Carboxydothermus islandicus]|uniref:Flagellar hook capping protein n=1 Tax=Carboxydothermus islandicus TaxID=661089 RepID=A0A1L8D4R5_9THEO|nr:flagellar hook capping FlgD N-terminal domain-containing protein [Carboxydothermus islandicus]GAV26163.1 hypothetical protein ciss_20960 [Carboxydothermus islandicus]